MNNSWVLLYGFIQGVTEFLPVSSSAHLALIPFFTKLKDPGVVFDLMMHLGTALAVVIYFWKEVKVLCIQFGHLLKRNLDQTQYLQNFMIATLGSFGLILIIKNLAFEFGRSPLIIGINLIIFGALMYWSDRIASKQVNLARKKDYKKALIIGLAQSLAVFPGVSRSGITLTAGRYLGMGRLEASRFSFLLSLPVIIGSAVFKLPELLAGEGTYVAFDMLMLGIVSSFFFGLVTIHFFLKLISKIGLKYFSFYRFLLGGLLIILVLLGDSA